MKYILSTFIIISLAFTLQDAHAQEDTDARANNSLSENSRALQFGIGENFRLSNFDGSAFSYKRHTAANRANRIALSFDNQFNRLSDPDVDDSETNRTRLSLNMNYTWMHYTDPEADVKLYYGYGPGFSFLYDNQNPPGDDNSTTISGLGLYGTAYTGVEWFFHHSISLHAEYRGTLMFSRISQSRDAASDSRDTSIRLRSNGVMFGLSAYF